MALQTRRQPSSMHHKSMAYSHGSAKEDLFHFMVMKRCWIKTLSKGNGSSFLRDKVAECETYIYVVQSIRMCRVLPPLPHICSQCDA